MADFKIPGGSEKGLPLNEASESTLKHWVQSISGKLADGTANPRFAAQDKALVEAMKAELASRGVASPAAGKAPAAPPAAAPSTALARSETKFTLAQSTHDPAAITAKLTELSASYHMVMPATRVDVLPPGCGIAVSFVTVDPSTDKNGPKEVYEVGGRLGLSGDTMKRIGAAAGVDWNPQQSGRLDDGKNPHYCHFRAVGMVRNFDGSIRTITGEVEIDAREGSPLIDEIRKKAEKRQKQYPDSKGDGGASQILELRKFLLRHAESKAKNRAIADMGVKRSYAPAELQKPFAVARLMWTGQSDDPVLRREFARMGAERMLDGTSRLYGNQPQGLPPRSSVGAFEGHGAPSLGSVTEDYHDLGTEDFEAHGEAVRTPLPTHAAPAPAATAVAMAVKEAAMKEDAAEAAEQAAAKAAAPAPAAQSKKAKPAEPPPGAGDAYEPEDDEQPSLIR